MITILIPTMNRSDFLRRLLYYYAAVKYQHWIYIGDSSDSFHSSEIKKTISRIGAKLKIRYFEYVNCRDSECMKKMICEVKTPYAVYVADDDFLIPAGLNRCIKFLEENQNYIGANGQAIMFTLKEIGPYGQFVSVGQYLQRGLYAETAAQRLIQYLNSYFVLVFSVCRVELWKEMYKNVSSIPDRGFSGELLPCCVVATGGNIKHFDDLYLIRQVHDRRYTLRDAYDWIINPQWNSSYQIFRDSLAEMITCRDGISKEEAYKVIKQALGVHMSVIFAEFQRRHGGIRTKVKNSVREIIKGIPPASFLLRRVRDLMSPISLSSLLSIRSPYHKDFIQIYNSVTQGNVDKKKG